VTRSSGDPVVVVDYDPAWPAEFEVFNPDFSVAIERLRAAAYLSEGELGVPGREGFAWLSGERRHHLYLAVESDPRVGDVIAFRDHLRRQTGDAAAYTDLKRELAARHRSDRDAYARGKSVFVRKVLARARIAS
jgi:GrpB-like predicted nucleotidyltransferase (UPF0157 family)